jgi:hypothetical protein
MKFFKLTGVELKPIFQILQILLKNKSMFHLSNRNGTLCWLNQAESKTVLNSLLIGLNGLQKPQLLVTENYTFPLHLKLGYYELNQQISMKQILNKFSQSIYTASCFKNPSIDSDISLQPIKFNVCGINLLQELRQKLEKVIFI